LRGDVVDGRVEYDGPAMTESGPLLDLDTLLESVGGDRELLDELAATFIAEVPGWIASLRAGLESGQPETVFRVAHGVSGAVGYFRAAGVRNGPWISRRPDEPAVSRVWPPRSISSRSISSP